MTGFARAEGEAEGTAWTWELKSVNGRGLDVRCRVPAGCEALEAKARKLIGEGLTRGNVNANLQTALADGTAEVRVNWPVLDTLAAAAKRLEQEYGVPPASADGLLALRGVVEPVSEDGDETAVARREAAIIEGLAVALQALREARDGEGAALARIVVGQVDAIERLVGEAEACAGARPEAIRRRIQDQVNALLSDGTVNEDRLAQEIALLVTKADIREELDRLRAHVAAARALLADGGAVGRKLDFLAQEFNREANTLCSKSQDTELTRVGIDLKTVIDQFREQAQNIE
jgi:uncharacterized protein (TIGR00255 family)